MNYRSEYKKCLLDVSRKYMIEKYLLKDGIWKMHGELLDTVSNKKCTVVTKSRDIGFTTILAAYTACELVLNSDGVDDKNFNVYYLALSKVISDEFMKKVLQFLHEVPEELFSVPNVKITKEHDIIKIGMASLKCSIVNKNNELTIDTFRGRENVDLVIFDEPVCCVNEWVNVYNIKKLLDSINGFSKKVIIGGNPNHKNKWWFEVVTEAKENGSYIIMPWYINPNHMINKYDEPKLNVTSYVYSDYSIKCSEEFTNEWLNKMKSYFYDDDKFDEGIGCKVWREKNVKEYV